MENQNHLETTERNRSTIDGDMKNDGEPTVELVGAQMPKWTDWTAEDWLSDKPLELLDAEKSLTKRMQTLERMAARAKKTGVGNLKTIYRTHTKEQETQQENRSFLTGERRLLSGGNIVEGVDLEMQFGSEWKDRLLYCGSWESDEQGVRKATAGGMLTVCPHPIFPIGRSTDLTGSGEALTVAFYNHGQWVKVSAPRSTFAVKDSLVRFLSEHGAAVTSETAGKLSTYLLEVDARSDLPESAYTSRCGWVKGGGVRAFLPFFKKGIEIDVIAPSVHHLPVSIHSAGDEAKSTAALLEAWNHSVPVRIVIAASFASVLLEDLGCLPFVVHIWSPESGTGKSVSLMAAASLWANPDLQTGHYIQQMQTTAAALPHIAGFLHDLPLVLDEYQLAKGRGADLLYMLTQGREKGKGQRNGGGIQNTKSWKCVTLTSGETPLTLSSDGAGALNRCISIHCTGPLFKDARATANAVKANYGHLGRKALFAWMKGGENEVEGARAIFQAFQNRPEWRGITDKQVDAAAALLTAAALFSATAFRGCHAAALEAKDLLPWLVTQKQADRGRAAEEFVEAWVAENAAHFWGGGDPPLSPYYGKHEDGYTYIIKTVLDAALKEEGYSPQAIYTSWESRGVIPRRRERNFGEKQTISGTGRPRCIRLMMDWTAGESCE